MEFIAPIPFQDAIDKLGKQSVVGSTFSSSEWRDLPVQLRDNAFFSSRVESARVLQRGKDLLGDFLSSTKKTAENGEPMLSVGSRADFISQMQNFLAGEGIVRTHGGLTDIASERRLGLIFSVKARQSQDFGYWKQGMDPAVLNEFPAQRFIRVRDVKQEREAHIPYENQVYLKTDPIWALRINHDFGVPWGPWGWGCGHDVEDEDRDTAERLHLIKPGQVLQPHPRSINDDLQASIKTMDPDLVEKLKKEFGNKVTIEGDVIRWNVEGRRQNEETVSPGSPAREDSRPTTERQSPVSDAIQVTVRGDLKAQVNAAIAAIDEVHDDGVLPRIPLKSTTRNALGFFSPQSMIDNNYSKGLTASYIAVRANGHWPALTLVHEVGHFLDLDGIGQTVSGLKGRYASMAGHAGMAAVLAAAEKTAAIRSLRAHRQAHFDAQTGYLLKPVEIWARAYAQYIATRSSSELLKSQLKKALDLGFYQQWPESEFEVIAQAIDKMFAELNWVR